MEKRIKRSVIALLFACTWGVFALCSPVAVRPITARASFMDDKITIMVYDSETLDLDKETNLSTWGIFYRGLKLLETVSYDLDTGSGEAGLAIVEDENSATFIDSDQVQVVPNNYSKLVQESKLNTLNCEHDFISGAGEQNWTFIDDDDDDSHWAECSDCGAKLQVAHRPDGKGDL